MPTKVSEEQTLDFKVPQDLIDKYDRERLKPEPGWKYVYVEFVVENISNSVTSVQLSPSVLDSAVLKTAEGFQYTNPVKFYYTGIYWGVDFSPTCTFFGSPGLNTLPPGFRALGVYNGYLNMTPLPSDTAALTNRVAFRVGEKTSGYRLNVPGFAEVDLTKGLVDAKSLRFPTDQPDSQFNTFGTSINVPNKGSITVEGVKDRTYKTLQDHYEHGYRQQIPVVADGTKVKIGIRFHNESSGYGQNFSVTVKLFGDDGILYTAWRDQDGYVVDSGEVAPGQDVTKDIDIVTSPTLTGGKLVIAGDINEIYNVQLPNPTKIELHTVLMVTEANLKILNSLAEGSVFERISSGNYKLVWPYGQQLVVPNSATNLYAVGTYTQTKDGAGNYPGECVSFVKALTETSNVNTDSWEKGPRVIENGAAPGTAIATFTKNNGTQFNSGIDHAAIYEHGAYWIWDQNWDGTGVVGYHTMSRTDISNYYIILLPSN